MRRLLKVHEMEAQGNLKQSMLKNATVPSFKHLYYVTYLLAAENGGKVQSGRQLQLFAPVSMIQDEQTRSTITSKDPHHLWLW